MRRLQVGAQDTRRAGVGAKRGRGASGAAAERPPGGESAAAGSAAASAAAGAATRVVELHHGIHLPSIYVLLWTMDHD